MTRMYQMTICSSGSIQNAVHLVHDLCIILWRVFFGESRRGRLNALFKNTNHFERFVVA